MHTRSQAHERLGMPRYLLLLLSSLPCCLPSLICPLYLVSTEFLASSTR
jgi:hypothetical protein